MTSRDFCFWLQGLFELNPEDNKSLTENQVRLIKAHLNLVFKHEIDPSMGGQEHQKELNEVHKGLGLSPSPKDGGNQKHPQWDELDPSGLTKGLSYPEGPKYRC